MKVLYYLVFASWYVMSLLPLRILYFVSDILYFPLFYVMKYRRKVVRQNLESSFPEKRKEEIDNIEKKFYHFFCDYVVETIKQFSMSKKQMMKRITFSGLEDMVSDMDVYQKNFLFIYLGHYCNWEWVASFAYSTPKEIHCSQIYHPLRNKAFDQLFLDLRSKFGGESIPMKETLRRIITLKREKQKTFIGFISDQAPKWNSIHHWCDFLHHDTPVFTGTEKIGKQVDALIYFADIRRVKRGYYHCDFKRMTTSPKDYPDFELTDEYMRLLEQMIQREPAYWLWSHKRWKRTRQEWEKRQKEKE